MSDGFFSPSAPTLKKKGSMIINYIGKESNDERPIDSYKEKFKNTYNDIKSSLQNVRANIKNYTNEISRLEDFLGMINEHENNYNNIIQRFNNLKKKLEETIQMENIIKNLSSNQQIINMSEYVSIYHKVKELLKYFSESNIPEKENYKTSLRASLQSAFIVYTESFYIILRRYEQLENTSSTENERLNLLNKIRSLAECLQDPTINYDFSQRLIKEHSEKITQKIDDIRIDFSKTFNEDNYEKNCGLYTQILMEVEKLFKLEREYIERIFQTCMNGFARQNYRKIVSNPLEKIMALLSELLTKIQRPNAKMLDFYYNFDVLNFFYEKISYSFIGLVEEYDQEKFNNITSIFKSIESLCFNFIENYLKEISNSTDKVEGESILNITNQAILFLSKITLFEESYKKMTKMTLHNSTINGFSNLSNTKFNSENLLEILIARLEKSSYVLEKKYQPLKYLFLMNNIYFIQTKLGKGQLAKFVDNKFSAKLTDRINAYLKNYLNYSWGKVEEITFNNTDLVNIYNNDGVTLKNSVKELLKKKFSTFNDAMKLNLKFQQNAQVVDPYIEKLIINANINTIVDRYDVLYKKYADSGFTKFKERHLIYQSESDVIRDLKLYFSNPLGTVNK